MVSTAATSQDGVISLEQLGRAGITRRSAAHRAAVGRLHRVHRGVYAVGHDAVSARGRLIAAALVCGPGSAISHLSAAALWRLRDPAPAVIDVIVPCETGRKIDAVIDVIVPCETGRKIDGIRARRCRYPTPEEMTVCDGVPCTTPSRTLVDLAGILGSKSLRRAVEQAAVVKVLDLAALDTSIAQAKGRRGIRALTAILVSWRSGDGRLPRLRSLLEARVFPVLVEAGLPRPECNVDMWVDGHRLEVDLLWEEQRLVIETDGEETHGTRAAFQRDRWRDQVLTSAGYRVARVTWHQLGDEPDAIAARIRRMLDPGARSSDRVVP